jgi:hypothetical protein
MEKVKTGECYYRDEEGAILLATSYVDSNGEIFTEVVVVEPATPE